MKTETKVSVIAYDCEVVDLRTGEHIKDTTVLERSWLDVLNRLDVSDRDFLIQTYKQKGYHLLKMDTRRKLSLSIDLGKLYADLQEQEAAATAKENTALDTENGAQEAHISDQT